MKTDFQIEALPRSAFEALLAMNDEELAAHHASWLKVDSEPGYPCRVSLEDARAGERVMALSWAHHDVDSPYRSSGPIFVREHAETAIPAVNEIPQMLRHRLLSLHAYDQRHYMINCGVVEGEELENSIREMFKDSKVDYIHIHNANPGCFDCAVYRA